MLRKLLLGSFATMFSKSTAHSVCTRQALGCGTPPSPAGSPREGAGQGWAGQGTSAYASPLHPGHHGFVPPHLHRGAGQPQPPPGPQPLCPRPEGSLVPRSPLPAEPAPSSSAPRAHPAMAASGSSRHARHFPAALPGDGSRGGAGRSGAGRGGCCGRRGARRRQRRQEYRYLAA